MQVVHEVHDRIMPLPLPCMMIMVMDAMRFDSKKWQLLQVFKSNLFQNVFFTTHWHPRGHVMPLKLGLAAAAAFRTRTPASHFKKVQNCFCLDQDLPLGTSNLCRLAQLASCSCSGLGRRRRTERKEMMD